MRATCVLAALVTALSAAGAHAQDAYRLGPDDQLALRGLDADELTGAPVTVAIDGTVNLPLAGRFRAAGLTLPQFEAELNSRLRAHILAPALTATVTEYRSQPVSVLGAVKNPGVYQVRGQKTLLEALSLAGGLREDAGPVVKLARSRDHGRLTLPRVALDPTGTFDVADIGVRSLMEASAPAENVAVTGGDVITVPRAGMVYVVGDVRRAGGFVLGERDTMSLLQALSLAEGLTPGASPKGAKILRASTDGGSRTEVPVNLSRTLAGKAPDLQLRPDDILFVPGSLAKKTSLRVLEAAISLGTGIAIYRR